jgi:[ribosomal protein S5]-alanine N-acetyltransferase
LNTPINPSAFYHDLPTLDTGRLRLRKLRLTDAGAYLTFAGDPRVTQYLRWGPHTSIDVTEDYLVEVLQGYADGSDGPWGIELNSEHRLIGTIHLMEIDPHNQKADIGVVLARKYWGKGIGSEALTRVLVFCFAELGLNRVQGLSIVGNIAARRMMEKCGMVYEGTLRQYAFQKGQFQDFNLMAILKGE